MPRAAEYVRGNVRSAGTQEHLFTATEYSSVWIGTPREPFAGRPVVTLRFRDGSSVRSDQLDAAWLRAHADRTGLRRAPSLLADEGWPANAGELAVGGFRFVVHADRVLGFGFGFGFGRLDSRETPAPELGDAEGRVYHRPPLRESELVALFGSPDRIRKWTSK